MMKKILLITCLALAACSDSFRGPTISDAKSMSGDTLCFRAASARESAAVDAEIQSRNLDCREIIENQPKFDDRGY